jgi:hypothetical protein
MADRDDGAQGLHDLRAKIAARLARLPLSRAGFEERSRRAVWVFLGKGPIGDDMAPVIEQLADDIACLIWRWRRRRPKGVKKPSEAERATRQKFRAFALAWQDLPEGSRPSLDWGVLSRGMRSAVAEARWRATRTTKGDVADMIVTAYYELTGETPSWHSSYDTPCKVLVWDIFVNRGHGRGEFRRRQAVGRFNTSAFGRWHHCAECGEKFRGPPNVAYCSPACKQRAAR